VPGLVNQGDRPAAEDDASASSDGVRLRTLAARAAKHRAVLVTVALTLLTAWIFPALVHQWQDRQKARELTAALVTNIGTSTSEALVTSALLSSSRLQAWRPARENQCDPNGFDALDLDWRTSKAEIEAQLQAYYSRGIVTQWRTYGDLVQETYFLITCNKSMRATTVDKLKNHLPPNVRRRVNWPRLATPWHQTHALPSRKAYMEVSAALLTEKAEIIEHIVEATPAGFSTRFSDLLHDLIPAY